MRSLWYNIRLRNNKFLVKKNINVFLYWLILSLVTSIQMLFALYERIIKRTNRSTNIVILSLLVKVVPIAEYTRLELSNIFASAMLIAFGEVFIYVGVGPFLQRVAGTADGFSCKYECQKLLMVTFHLPHCLLSIKKCHVNLS